MKERSLIEVKELMHSIKEPMIIVDLNQAPIRLAWLESKSWLSFLDSNYGDESDTKDSDMIQQNGSII